jgi:hypothetical protein
VSTTVEYDVPSPKRFSPACDAVFIHSGWRSTGTWIWSEFRENPHVMAFYEPLHELFKDISLEGIRRESPAEWDSHHPDGRPYFEEFTPLLARRGIARYHRSFAFDRFFLARDEREPRLQAYLSQLVDLAHCSGKLPVLKFCRSHGRVAWMRAHFPNALHVAVLRDPVAHWNSAWRQVTGGNPYFLAAPMAILSRHLSEPVVAQFAMHLGVRLRPLRRRSFDRTYEQCGRFVQSSSAATLYRSYLAFWLVSAWKSLPHVDTTIDVGGLGSSMIYRKNVQDVLLASTGVAVDFTNARVAASGGIGDGLRAGEVRSAHADALRALAATVGAFEGAGEEAADVIARALNAPAAPVVQRGLTEPVLFDSQRVGQRGDPR